MHGGMRGKDGNTTAQTRSTLALSSLWAKLDIWEARSAVNAKMGVGEIFWQTTFERTRQWIQHEPRHWYLFLKGWTSMQLPRLVAHSLQDKSRLVWKHLCVFVWADSKDTLELHLMRSLRGKSRLRCLGSNAFFPPPPFDLILFSQKQS